MPYILQMQGLSQLQDGNEIEEWISEIFLLPPTQDVIGVKRIEMCNISQKECKKFCKTFEYSHYLWTNISHSACFIYENYINLNVTEDWIHLNCSENFSTSTTTVTTVTTAIIASTVTTTTTTKSPDPICRAKKIKENEYEISCTKSASSCCELTMECKFQHMYIGSCQQSINFLESYLSVNDTVLNQELGDDNGCKIIVKLKGKLWFYTLTLTINEMFCYFSILRKLLKNIRFLKSDNCLLEWMGLINNY